VWKEVDVTKKKKEECIKQGSGERKKWIRELDRKEVVYAKTRKIEAEIRTVSIQLPAAQKAHAQSRHHSS
jgi:hypothetical protein